jgi:glycine hydroxymethyltransferase
MTGAAEFFSRPIGEADGLVAAALDAETERQSGQIELIASENLVSRAVLDAMGHIIANKTLEGYPGNRFHGGGENVDTIEQLAIDRAKELFGCAYANVQPHSGTQANLAAFVRLVEPGDRLLSLDLAAGGHLSHGARANLSGRWFETHHYTVDRDTGLINYDAVARQAEEVRPKLLIAGGSAYPREIDFARMAAIARDVGASFLVDMAHIAGLVAGGVHPSPLPHADIVTCTTTKTLRGPRGGVILARDEAWTKKLQSAVFPGAQGSLHTQILAGKAVCLGEALQPEFQAYARQIHGNARALARILADNGIKVISGGTDTHIVLLDLSPQGINGQQAQDALAQAGITSNKNPIPFDSPRPAEWVGLRLGVSAATTRGFTEREFEALGGTIAEVISAEASGGSAARAAAARSEVALLCERFPIYR